MASTKPSCACHFMSLLLAANGFKAMALPWQYAIVSEFGDHRAHTISPSFWITVDLNIPVREKILITPSSPAVSNPDPSELHRHDVIAALCAAMLRSTLAPLFKIIKRPSDDAISKFSLLFPPDLAMSQLKSVGMKSGIFATWTNSRLDVVHFTIWQSSLKETRHSVDFRN